MFDYPYYVLAKCRTNNSEVARPTEVKLAQKVVEDFGEEMDKKGFHEDSYKRIDAVKVSQYLQALNGIMPKDCQIDTEVDKTHTYKYSNRNLLTQIYDEQTGDEVMNIAGKSILNK